MKILEMLTVVLMAGLASLITRPLLGKRLSQYGLFVLNIFLGIIMAVILFVMVGDVTEEQAEKLVPLFALVLMVMVGIMKALPDGENRLKSWYIEPSEEDDKEYFSQRNMRGKPWWKFMFIPGWISLVFFNLLWILGLLFWLWTDDSLIFGVGLFCSLFFSPIMIWNAVKRKRDYDRNYK